MAVINFIAICRLWNIEQKFMHEEMARDICDGVTRNNEDQMGDFQRSGEGIGNDL